jgi:hypothetical protein
VSYELGIYISEDILGSPRRENLKSYIALTGWALLPMVILNMAPLYGKTNGLDYRILKPYVSGPVYYKRNQISSPGHEVCSWFS